MRIVIFCLIVGAVVCEQYTSKYDNVNIDEILSSDRLLKNYFKCLMDRGPCAPDASELKKVVPDALQTDCSKCSDSQRQSVRKVVRFLVNKKPEMWKELSNKYDPDGVYLNKYKDELYS